MLVMLFQDLNYSSFVYGIAIELLKVEVLGTTCEIQSIAGFSSVPCRTQHLLKMCVVNYAKVAQTLSTKSSKSVYRGTRAIDW